MWNHPDRIAWCGKGRELNCSAYRRDGMNEHHRTFEKFSIVKWKCTWVSKIFLQHFLWYVWHFCGRNSFLFLEYLPVCSFVTTFCGQITQPLITFPTFCMNEGMNEWMTDWRSFSPVSHSVFCIYEWRRNNIFSVHLEDEGDRSLKAFICLFISLSFQAKRRKEFKSQFTWFFSTWTAK